MHQSFIYYLIIYYLIIYYLLFNYLLFIIYYLIIYYLFVCLLFVVLCVRSLNNENLSRNELHMMPEGEGAVTIVCVCMWTSVFPSLMDMPGLQV